MIKLDDDLLAELGLSGLPPEEKKKLLAHIYETLEMRVGMKLAEQMSDAQLAEFEQFINSNDEAGALRWLETNFPNYKDVVASEFENLKREISHVGPQILAAATQQAQAQPQMAAPAPGVAPGQPMAQPQQYQSAPQPQPMAPHSPATPYQPQPSMPPQQPQAPLWAGDQAQGVPNPWQQPPQPQ